MVALCGASLGATALPSTVQAQSESILVDPLVPQGFDKGRNISVLERGRPDFDPLGIQTGGFDIYPSLTTGLGYTDNVYLDETDKTATGYALIAPAVRARSSWSRHEVVVRAAGQFRRFFGESRRNENAWNVGAVGRADVTSAFSLTGEGQAARVYETPFSGQTQGDLAVLSSYYRTLFAARGAYESGRIRLTLAGDRSGYDFNRINLGSGVRRDQSDRDRIIGRFGGQAEYAVSPSISTFGQLSVDEIDYSRRLLNGVGNRDSSGFRASGGFNFDLASLARGTIAVGFVDRNYRNAIYRDVSGFSVESQFEYFYSDLTNFTVGVRRVLQDANLGDTAAFFDNRIQGRVDHELLRNLLLNVQAEASRQNYLNSPLRNSVYRLSGGARYLSTRRIGLAGDLSYTDRRSNSASLGGDFSEFRAQVSLVLQR